MNYLPNLPDDWKDVAGGGCWDRSEEVTSVDLLIQWFCSKLCYSQWKNPHHCALLVCICSASTLGLSLPLIYRSQDKTFNKTFSEQNVEAEVLPQKIRGAVENRSLALCTGLWTGTEHAVLQLWPTKLKPAWPCIWADSLDPFAFLISLQTGTLL